MEKGILQWIPDELEKEEHLAWNPSQSKMNTWTLQVKQQLNVCGKDWGSQTFWSNYMAVTESFTQDVILSLNWLSLYLSKHL